MGPKVTSALRGGLGRELSQQCVDIERAGEHPQFALDPRPFPRGPVPIKLDAITIRVPQIDGLTHAVIGRTFDGNSVSEQALEGPRQLQPRRVQHREMI